METMQFEPMSVGRIFDRAFLIYRNNFLRFITIVAVIEVPLALLSTVSGSWGRTKATTSYSRTSEPGPVQPGARVASRQYDSSYEVPSAFGLVGVIAGVLLQLVGTMLCQAALIKNVSEAYLGNEITIGQAYQFALPKAVTLVLAAICVGLVVGLGFLLLVVPGVIFALWFFLTTPAIVVENHSATSGMSRSKALVAGNLGKAFAVGLVALVAPEFETVRTYSTVPFFKNLMIDFGLLYIPMVILVITGTSNAVNLTDGLDGLAIGLVGIASLAWAGISYVTGRVDFSQYLNINYLRGAGEITVYCSALIGASLGFLWYNSHPASVIMGDTGALALGGVLGTMAVLLKKEILLLIVGGVFWAENVSVVLQVASFKWRGKRIFKMAPIHHHFELLGWPEEKIVVRFWIVGVLLALLTLGTFKVR